MRVALAGLALAIPPVAAADPPRFVAEIPSGVVKQLMELARRNIGSARLPDGSFVPPENALDRAEPIVAPADAERIIDIGFASGMAAWCGVDWQRGNFSRLIDAERARKVHTDKAMAYIGLLHGVAMGMIEAQMRAAGRCSPEQRRHLEDFIRRRWE